MCTAILGFLSHNNAPSPRWSFGVSIQKLSSACGALQIFTRIHCRFEGLQYTHCLEECRHSGNYQLIKVWASNSFCKRQKHISLTKAHS
ncbi:hypothetical protein HanIR_Chr17g0888061 [Helianthus annuus]|nr:hypothetical protein HanIR_Chr17g0888061 [Helianthus annuus]